MLRITRFIATLSLVYWVASCGAPPAADLAETEAALTVPRAVDVCWTIAGCRRTFLPATGAVSDAQLIDGTALGYGTVVSVATGPEAAAWVCDHSSPWGFTHRPSMPCSLDGGNSYQAQRVRGAETGNPSPYTWATYPYAATSFGPATRTPTIVGRSVVVSRGTLASPPPCPYTQTQSTLDDPTHWHGCPTRGDSGLQDWYSNNAPDDSNYCCNTRASDGGICADHANGSGAYAVENYGGCPVY